MSFSAISVPPYLVVPEELPLLPEPLLLPEPMPEPLLLLEPGVLVLLLPDAPPLELLPLLPLAPLVDPPEAAPDDLKCASHSCREICPSPFLSTDEKLGACELAPLDALGEEALGEALLGEELLGEEAPDDELLGEEAPDEELLGEDELEEPPEALPEDLLSAALGLELLPEDLLSAALGLELLLELCAIATPASAKSAAAVAVLTTFLTNMNSS